MPNKWTLNDIDETLEVFNELELDNDFDDVMQDCIDRYNESSDVYDWD